MIGDPQKRKALYDSLTKDGYSIGTAEEFNAKMEDPVKVKALYEGITSDGYDVGDFESFSTKVGPAPTQPPAAIAAPAMPGKPQAPLQNMGSPSGLDAGLGTSIAGSGPITPSVDSAGDGMITPQNTPAPDLIGASRIQQQPDAANFAINPLSVAPEGSEQKKKAEERFAAQDLYDSDYSKLTPEQVSKKKSALPIMRGHVQASERTLDARAKEFQAAVSGFEEWNERIKKSEGVIGQDAYNKEVDKYNEAHSRLRREAVGLELEASLVTGMKQKFDVDNLLLKKRETDIASGRGNAAAGFVRAFTDQVGAVLAGTTEMSSPVLRHLTDESIMDLFGVLPEGSKKLSKKEFNEQALPYVRNWLTSNSGIDRLVSKEYVDSKKDNSLFYGGMYAVAEMIPGIAASMTPAGAPAMAGSFFFSSYDQLGQEMSDPIWDDVDDAEKEAIRTGISLVSAGLSTMGMQAVAGKMPIVKDIWFRAARKLLPGMSPGVIRQVIDSETKSYVANVASQMAQGFVAEGIEESLDYTQEEGFKAAYENYKETEFGERADALFNNVETIKQYRDGLLNSFVIGGIAGDIVGGSIAAVSSIGARGRLTEKEFDVFRNILASGELKSQFEVNAKVALEDGKMSQSEYDKLNANIEVAQSAINQIPEDMAVEPSRKAFDLLMEKAKLKKLDKALVGDKVAAIDEQLSALAGVPKPKPKAEDGISSKPTTTSRGVAEKLTFGEKQDKDADASVWSSLSKGSVLTDSASPDSHWVVVDDTTSNRSGDRTMSLALVDEESDGTWTTGPPSLIVVIGADGSLRTDVSPRYAYTDADGNRGIGTMQPSDTSIPFAELIQEDHKTGKKFTPQWANELSNDTKSTDTTLPSNESAANGTRNNDTIDPTANRGKVGQEVAIQAPPSVQDEVPGPEEPRLTPSGFTEASVINRDHKKLKESLGERKAKKYFDQVDRLFNPNNTKVVEYRENGVVTEASDGTQTFHGLADMDAKKWRVSFSREVEVTAESGADTKALRDEYKENERLLRNARALPVGVISYTEQQRARIDALESRNKEIYPVAFAKEVVAEKAQKEASEKELEEKRDVIRKMRESGIASAPVYQKRNGYEIVKYNEVYHLRDPETKESIHNGTLKRVREVADEIDPFSPSPKEQFQVDDKLMLSAPDGKSSVEVSFRGIEGDKAIVWTGRMQMSVDPAQLSKPPTAPKKVAAATEKTPEVDPELDALLDVKRQDLPKQEGGQDASSTSRMTTDKATALLKKVAPGVKVITHKDQPSLSKAYARNSGRNALKSETATTKGFYDTARKEIHIGPFASETTLAHEVMHPLFRAAMAERPASVKALYDELLKDPDFATYIDHGNRPGYKKQGEAMVMEEAIVQFMAAAYEGKLDEKFKNNKGLLQRVRDFIKDILAKLGLRKSEIDFSNIENLKQMAGLIHEAARTGGVAVASGSQAGSGIQQDQAFNGPEVPTTPIGDTKTVTVDGKERTVFNSEGRPIHPTVEGARNFWRWFEGSRVVDAEGRPLVVYHGTRGDFDSFSVSGREKTKDSGAFFSSSRDVAATYSGGTGGASIMPVYLRLTSPLIVDGKGGSWGDLSEAVVLNEEGGETGWTVGGLFGHANSFTDSIGRKLGRGYDSAILNNLYDMGARVVPKSTRKALESPSSIFIVKDPTQIKSATGNYGSFDPREANILMARANSKEIAEAFKKKGYPKEAAQEYMEQAGVDEAVIEDVIGEMGDQSAEEEYTPKVVETEAERIKQYKEERDQSNMGPMGPVDASKMNEEQRSFVTGTKNAVVDAERLERMADPIYREAKKTNEQTFTEAEAIAQANPLFASEVIRGLNDGTKTTVSEVEEALMLFEKIRLRNERARLTDIIDNKNTPENTMAEAVEQWSVLEDKINEVDLATRKSGTIWGRLGQFRQRMMNEDYSFEEMERKARVAKGDALTESESKKIKEQADQIADLERKLSDARLRAEEGGAVKALEQEVKAMQEQISSESRTRDFSPRVIRIAEKMVADLDIAADAARARMRARLGQMSSGVDPAVLYDISVIGAAKLGHAALDFAKWSDVMISDLGKNVKPYLEKAWENAEKIWAEKESAIDASDRPGVKGARKQKAEKGATLSDIKELVVGRIDEGFLPEEIQPLINKLALAFVRDGVTDRNDLVEKVHEVISEGYPDLTKPQTRDIISGYGKYKKLDKEPAKAVLRGLRGEMQQIGKIEDMMAKMPPKKTGMERRESTPEERRLTKEVNDLKRKGGFTVTDPEAQLKSALGAIKTRLRNEIIDIDNAIAKNLAIPRSKNKVRTDAELEALRSERDEAKVRYDAVFPKKALTQEQLLEAAEKSIDRSIALLEKNIKEGAPRPVVREALSSPAIEAKRAKLEALRSERDELRELKDPGYAERTALKAYKKRALSKIAELKQRIADGDFSKKEQKQVSLDVEGKKIALDLNEVKKKFMHDLFMHNQRSKSKATRIKNEILHILNTSRAIITSFDLSAAGRQGMLLAFAHPSLALRAGGKMLRAVVSKANYQSYWSDIQKRPNAELYRTAKLFLVDPNEYSLSKMEEAYMSRYAEYVPGVGASQRAYTTYLNEIRADAFDMMVKNMGLVNTTQARAIANYINISTGRGNLAGASGAAISLNAAFFSPRLVVSRFEYLLGQPMYGGDSATRKAIAKEYAKTAIGAFAAVALYKTAKNLLGDKDDDDDEFLDPRSSSFLKMRIGEHTHVDMFAGLIQAMVLMSRIASGEKTTINGKVIPIRGDVPYGSDRTWDVFATFMRTKLSPPVSAFWNIASGANVIGEETSAAKEALGMVAPMTVRDIYDAIKAEGVSTGVAIGILVVLGFGAQTYEDDKKKKAKKSKE